MATAEDYENALYLLLPKGPAWPCDFDAASTAQNFLRWLAREMARVEANSNGLFDEADPRTADTFLEAWLTEWGLPNECMKKFDQTVFPRDQLRTMLAAQIGTWGLTSVEAINFIGKLYGKDVDVQNVQPFTTASTVNRRLYDSAWRVYVVIVSISDNESADWFDCTWTVDQPLGRWGDELFECSVAAVIPAHLWPMFSYPDAADGSDGDLVFD